MAEPKMTNVTTEQVPTTPMADTPPFNAHHSKDVWKHLFVSLSTVSLG
jgi:hypothetical protein